MREPVDRAQIERLMQALGREAQGAGNIYFTGGACALLLGWRTSTVDVDMRLDPEPLGIFAAIAQLKQTLRLNVELTSPQDFLPPVPGWRTRSVFIARYEQVAFYHYDFVSQGLAKLARGFDRDLADVEAMYRRRLWTLAQLRDGWTAIAPELIRFPAVEAPMVQRRLEEFCRRWEESP